MLAISAMQCNAMQTSSDKIRLPSREGKKAIDWCAFIFDCRQFHAVSSFWLAKLEVNLLKAGV